MSDEMLREVKRVMTVRTRGFVQNPISGNIEALFGPTIIFFGNIFYEMAHDIHAEIDRTAIADEDGFKASDRVFVVVALAAAALEAAINELADSPQCRYKLPEDFLKKGILEKWDQLPRFIAKAKFDRGAAPWQDLHGLIQLRNIVLHMKVGHDIEDPPPWFERLEHRKLVPPPQPKQWWLMRATTTAVSNWSLTTVAAMCATMDNLLGDDLPKLCERYQPARLFPKK